MDTDQALALLWREADRSSLRRIVARIGVHASTASRWRAGDTYPEGENREKLLAWAEVQAAADSVPAAILEHAQRVTAENRERLSHIMGQAQAVADMMEALLVSQRRVVDSLRPWVTLETDLDSDAAVEARALAITRRVAGPALTPPTAAESPRPRTDAAAPRTTRPQDTAPTGAGSSRSRKTR